VGEVVVFGADVTCSDDVTNTASAHFRYTLLRRGIIRITNYNENAKICGFYQLCAVARLYSQCIFSYL